MSTDYGKKFSEGEFWQFIKKFVKDFPGVRDSIALFYCLKDSDTPLYIKVTIIGALGYLVSPLDAVPDFIPIVGLADDLGVIAGTLSFVYSHVKQEHWDAADELLGREKPEQSKRGI